MSQWAQLPHWYLTWVRDKVVWLLFLPVFFLNKSLTFMRGCKQRAKYACLHSCCLSCWCRSFCPCLIEPFPRSPELRELIEVNLEFQVQFWRLFRVVTCRPPSAAVTLQSSCRVFMSLLSSEATRGAAEQQAFLQGRLCRGAPAFPEARWPSTPAGAQKNSNPTTKKKKLDYNIVSADDGGHLSLRSNPNQSQLFCVPEQNGKIDMTFFTHDCFHFTIKGHEELAKGLWNNMVSTWEINGHRAKQSDDDDDHRQDMVLWWKDDRVLHFSFW